MVSFDDVQEYLLPKARGIVSEDVGKLTLAEIRSKINNDKTSLTQLMRTATLKRESEKVDELRQLKLRHQQRRAQRNQEEAEIKSLISELEKAKEDELRVRLDKEHIQQVLRSVEEADMRRMEQEKKTELEKLAREKEALLASEEAVRKEVESLQNAILEQELNFQRRSEKIDSVLQNKKENTSSQLQDLAKARGERMASLALERQQLSNRKAEIDAKLSQVSLEDAKSKTNPKRRRARGASSVMKEDHLGMNNNVEDTNEHEASSDEDDDATKNKKESTSEFVSTISSSIVDNELKLLQLKRQIEDERKNELDFDVQLSEIIPKDNRDGTSTLLDQVATFIDSEQEQAIERIQRYERGATVPPFSDALDKLHGSFEPKTTAKASPLSQSQEHRPPSSFGKSSLEATEHQLNFDTCKETEPISSPLIRESRRGAFGARQSPLTIAAKQLVNQNQQQQEHTASPIHTQVHNSTRHVFNDLPQQQRQQLPQQNTRTTTRTDPFQELNQLKAEYSHLSQPDPGLWEQIEQLEQELKQTQPPATQSWVHPTFPSVPLSSPWNPAPQPSGPYNFHNPVPVAPVMTNTGLPNPMETILQQQQEEIDRLTEELDSIVKEQRTQDRDEERSELSEALSKIGDAIATFSNKSRIGTLPHQGSGTNDSTDEKAHTKSSSDGGSMLSYVQDQANALKLLKSLPKESHIYRLQVNHMQEMAKIKFEMEALVQKKKLAKIKEELEREEQEAIKKAEHEQWKAEQSRQLAEARIRKVLAKENENLQNWNGERRGSQTGSSTSQHVPYDPQDGFMVYFDYTMNVPKTVSHVRLVYCVYDGTASKTRAKALPLSECDFESEFLVTSIFACRRLFQRVVANSNLRIAIEIQSVREDEASGNTRTQSIGWAVVKLFRKVQGIGVVLNEGPIKVKMIRPPLDVEHFDHVESGVGLPMVEDRKAKHLSNDELEALQQVGELEMYLRIVNFPNAEDAANFAVDPQLTSHLYNYPYGKGTIVKPTHQRQQQQRRRSSMHNQEHGHRRGRQEVQQQQQRHQGSTESDESGDEMTAALSSDEKDDEAVSKQPSEAQQSITNPASATGGSNLGVDGETDFETSNVILVQFNFLTMFERPENLNEFASYTTRFSLVTLDKSRKLSVTNGRRGSVASARRGSVASTRRGSVASVRGEGQGEGRNIRRESLGLSSVRATRLASGQTKEIGYSAGEKNSTQLTWNQEVTLKAEPNVALDGEAVLVVELHSSTESGDYSLIAWGVQQLGIESSGPGKISYGPRTMRLHHGSRVMFETMLHSEDGGDNNTDVINLAILPSQPTAERRSSIAAKARRGSLASQVHKTPDIENDSDDANSMGSHESVSSPKKAGSIRGFIEHVADHPQSTSEGGQHELFRRGDDGFDVYVDSARYLPDNVSVSMVQAKLLSRDFEVVGEVFVGYPGLDDSAFSPRYCLRGEFRGEVIANPSATLVMRVDGVDRYSGKTTVIGYSLLNAFCTESGDGEQPESNTEQNFLLNAGCFQLPILQHSPDQSMALSAKSLQDSPRVPCATLLVRILPAATSKDGLSTLSTADYDEEEWEARGLVIPPPDYAKAVYDSTRCRPLHSEIKMYPFRADREEPLVREMAVLIGSPEKTPEEMEALEDSELEEFMREKLGSPEGLIDMSKVAEYQMELGFKLGVDLAAHLSFGGGLRSSPGIIKVVYCLSPPGSYYEEPKLTEEVEFTTSHDWTSPQQNQWFVPDGVIEGTQNMHVFRDVPNDPFLCAILDVKLLKWKKGQVVCEDHGWAVLPIFDDNFVRNGVHQVPLLEGTPNKDFLQDLQSDVPMTVISNELALKKQSRIKLKSSSSSLIVRLIDTQLEDVVKLSATDKLIKDYLPDKTMSKYTCILERLPKEKKPLSKLIPKEYSNPAEFEKELNKQFATLTGIQHYAF